MLTTWNSFFKHIPAVLIVDNFPIATISLALNQFFEEEAEGLQEHEPCPNQDSRDWRPIKESGNKLMKKEEWAKAIPFYEEALGIAKREFRVAVFRYEVLRYRDEPDPQSPTFRKGIRISNCQAAIFGAEDRGS